MRGNEHPYHMLLEIGDLASSKPEAEQAFYLNWLLDALRHHCREKEKEARRSYHQVSRTLLRLLRRKEVSINLHDYENIVFRIIKDKDSASDLIDRLTFDSGHSRLRCQETADRIDFHIDRLRRCDDLWLLYGAWQHKASYFKREPAALFELLAMS